MKRNSFSCKSRKFIIRGYEYRTDKNNHIPVILSHGFLANQERLKPYAEYLANLGYVVFTYDFCGGGLGSRSDGKFCDMSIYTEKEDLFCVINYVEGLDYIDISKLVLVGESQGGLISCMVAADRGVDKLVLLYPALCIPDDARKGKMLFMKFNPDNIDTTLKCKLFRFSPDYPKSAINLNIDAVLERISAPTLIIHGDKDKIVPVDYAKKAKDILVNKDSRLVIISGARHGFINKQIKEANEQIKEFLQC